MTLADLIPIASKVAGVLMVMLAGALAVWFGWLDRHVDRSLASIIANVFFPAYFLQKIALGPPLGSMNEIWYPPLIGFSTTCVGFAIAWLTIRIAGPWFGITSPLVQRTFALTVGVANYGYIPLPLSELYFPNAFNPLLIHNIGVDIALWSVGLLVISGELKQGLTRLVRSLPLWTMIVGIVFQQMGWGKHIPGPLLQATELLGACAIPAGLMLGGAIIAENLGSVNWKQRLSILSLATIVRMGILPVIFLLVARYLPMTTSLDQVLLLQAAMPVATFPIVMTRLFGGDIDTSLRIVLGTSVVSLVTIPIWISVGCWILGIQLH